MSTAVEVDRKEGVERGAASASTCLDIHRYTIVELGQYEDVLIRIICRKNCAARPSPFALQCLFRQESGRNSMSNNDSVSRFASHHNSPIPSL